MLVGQSLFAADMPLKSSITSVTVYLAGAQVTRTAQVNLPKGAHTLIIENLPAKLNTQSIQVDGPDGLTLVGVSLRNEIKLNPSESKTLHLRYTLEYPKDKAVTVY
ncbi:MAG: DUF4140 domain-containing protein [Bacteroidetes bacterium]|nr:DUF4140 domain-containing protein [Bacteroidota bacterium]